MGETDVTSASTVEGSGSPAKARPAMFAPHRVIPDFLDEAAAAGLLALAQSEESQFQPSMVGRPGSAMVKADVRISSVLRRKDVLRTLFDGRLRALAPSIVEDIGMSPFAVHKVEVELAAHGDGAFYKRHIDIHTGASATSQRVLSAVYYFHQQPKAFSGGALRLHAIGGSGAFVDIEPVHNSLLVFPSWAPHEVMPISCPSGRFIDSRFAVNCWLRRQLAVDAGG